MKPVDPAIQHMQFVTYGEKQEQYKPLPARLSGSRVVTCWKLTFAERIKMFFQGRFYLTMLTFGEPLQPVKIEMEQPQ